MSHFTRHAKLATILAQSVGNGVYTCFSAKELISMITDAALAAIWHILNSKAILPFSTTVICRGHYYHKCLLQASEDKLDLHPIILTVEQFL